MKRTFIYNVCVKQNNRLIVTSEQQGNFSKNELWLTLFPYIPQNTVNRKLKNSINHIT